MNKFLLLCAGILLLISCSKDRLSGSGNTVTEQRSVNNFTRVKSNGSTNVHIVQGATFKVEVRGYQNLLGAMETKLNGATLEIGYKSGTNVKNDNVEVFITMPVLTSVSTNGSGNFDVKGHFTGNNLDAAISGSGSIAFEAGTIDVFEAEINGSGNVKAFGLNTQRTEVYLTGSGTAEVKASTHLKVSISGSGIVYYKGQPVIQTNISGSGRLEHRP